MRKIGKFTSICAVLLCLGALLRAQYAEPFWFAEMRARAEFAQFEKEKRTQKTLKQRDFELKFNQLTSALADFAEKYNAANGKVWPHREAEKVRKAIESLDKSLQNR